VIYGLGLDQSYFGLALAYVGYFRVGVYWWVFALLWLGLIIEGMNLGKIIYDRYLKPNELNKTREKERKSKKPNHDYE